MNLRAREWEAYQSALNPPKKVVSDEEWDEIFYEAVARNQSLDRSGVLAWMRRNYEVRKP